MSSTHYSHSKLGASVPQVILTSSNEGETNFKSWKAAALAAAGALGVQAFLTSDKAFDAASYAEHPPTLPTKVPPFEEKSNGETADSRVARRLLWTTTVNEYYEDMRHYEFQYNQFEKSGRPSAFAKFNQQAAQAVALLYALVTPDIASNFAEGATGHQLWVYLEKHYGTRSELYQSTSLSEILSTQLTEEETPQRTWETMSRRASELQSTDYAIPTKLLQKIFLQLFFDTPLYSYPYNKYRSQDLFSNDSKLFKAFLEEVTVCYGDARTKNGSSTNGLFGGVVPGKRVSPPAPGASNSVDATHTCQHCHQLGHRNYLCKKWRAKHPQKLVKFDVTDKVAKDKVDPADASDTSKPQGSGSGSSKKRSVKTKGLTAEDDGEADEECNVALDGEMM